MKKLLHVSVVFLLLFASQVFAQNRTITGTVTGKDDGLPLPGVSVTIKGTANGTQTNNNGTFSLTVPIGTNTLLFTYIGFVKQEVSINQSNTIIVSLIPDSKTLNEVVVVGYQTLERKDVVGSLSTVEGKEVAEKPIANFTQLLQGTAPGLQVTGASGRPGNTGVIRIRGVGSIGTAAGSSDPLIIVDGIQISTTAYSGINPDDIEQVTVLKDASATAIYGSRAGNGVLVITTKQGKPGAPTLSYSFQYGKSNAMKLRNLTLMNSQQKLQYEYELGFQNATLDSMITNRTTNGRLPAGSTIFSLNANQRQGLWDLASSRGAGSWRDYLLQSAATQTHEISLSGGADKIKYYFSLNSSNYDGVERFSSFDRKGGRLNIEYQAKEWFKIGTNIGTTVSHDVRVREAYNSQNSYAASFFFNPYEQPYNADGSYNGTLSSGFSPLEGAVNNPVTYDRINQFATIYGQANFFNHLTLKSQLGINYNTLKYQSYLQPGSYLATLLGYNQKSDQGNQDFFYVFTNTAQWNQTVAEKHNINALIGTEFNKSNVYSYNLTARGFPSASFTTLENAATPTTTTTSITEFALESYFANIGYNYDQRYYLTASARRDGSSRFGANVRYANFYSAGLAWSIKKENFLKSVDWITDLKLRGSYGTSGNLNGIGNYDALGTYSITTKYNNQTAAIPLRLANPQLTWETMYAKDLGLTFGFLDSYITGEIDYYDRNNRNLLYPVNVSQTTGFSSYTGNVGAVNNKGIEVELTGTILRKKDINLTVTGNYSHNDNKVIQLYSDNANGVNALGIARLVVGQPINTYYLVRSAGVNPADGNPQFYNIDGSITETYSAGQSQLLKGKSAVVKYFGSIGPNLTYKGLDLSARFYYSGGNYIFSQILQDGVSNKSNITSNQFTEAFNYWKKPGDNVPYPNPLNPNNQTVYDTDQYLQKGDYVSLRDLTIGYTFNNRFTQKVKLKNIRVFLQGTNLALWTKYKGLPEISEAGETTAYSGIYDVYGYPQVRAYTFGVNVRF